MRFILASTSENRRRLLRRMNIAFEVMAPDYEEVIEHDLPPEDQVVAFAVGKAASVWEKIKNEPGDVMVLGFDSMIRFEGGSLGKAKDAAEAQQMLSSFVGKKQQVVSGMAVMGRYEGREFRETIYESTSVEFRDDVNETEIAKYLTFGDWQGKCGAYSILGTGIWFLKYIDGDFQNIIGVPVLQLGNLITKITGKAPVEVLSVAEEVI